MLRRYLTRIGGVAGRGALGLLAAASWGCDESGSDPDPTGTTGAAIIGGSVFDGPASPVLYLNGPEGACSAVLLAPTLAATARHCVARTSPGSFSCTAAGDLVQNGGSAGQIGTDDPPPSIAFFSAQRVSAAGMGMGGGAVSPDAVGAQILSTQTPTACRDDLAFVVLSAPIACTSPAPIRLQSATQMGESVSIAGYGLTDSVAPTLLRVRSGAHVVGVGPDMPSNLTQLAPVRAIRTDPVTCEGDSGGPILSTATGAVIALVSLGSQAGSLGPFCNDNNLTDTIGPRLGAYSDLAMQAFAAAGANPILEATGSGEGGSVDAAEEAPVTPPPLEAGPDVADVATPGTDAAPDDVSASREADPMPDTSLGGEQPLGPVPYHANGGSCAAAPEPRDCPLGAIALALAWTACAVRRRTR